ncbi:MAG: MFS transporter [Phycisphaerae bacterium]|nr:MFS transporter [Phycisphaerae bacterium]
MPDTVHSLEIPATKKSWLSRDVLFISLSACFADLGYQSVLAIFPLFLVLTLRQPVWMFGLATAISYGPGAVFALIGGRMADRFGAKRMAISGNILIPLLSLSGLVTLPGLAIALFSGGWWARNFRSPPRRTMLTQAVTKEHRGQAFGFLHALDIGGGFLAALGTMLLVLAGVTFTHIFLLTIIPLLCSTLFLTLVRVGGKIAAAAPSAPGTAQQSAQAAANQRVYHRLLLSAALYGFSSFSIGFPILTVDQARHGTAIHNAAWAILSYVVFFGVSAVTGMVVGKKIKGGIRTLALWGYLLGGLAAAGMGLVWYTGTNPLLYYPIVGLMGLSLGVIETIEPTIISRLMPSQSTGRGMGALTAMRSLGLFVGNIAMGLLYHFGAAWSYGYAALLAIVASMLMLTIPAAESSGV